MIGSGFDRRDPGTDGAGSGGAGAKVRVYELAKECNLAPKDLVAKIRALGVDVANHMSNLEASDAERIRRSIERERQESLVETRLNDTVIRRRSRLPGGAGARPTPAVETVKPAGTAPKPAPVGPPAREAGREARIVFAVPEPTPPPVVMVEPPPLEVAAAPIIDTTETEPAPTPVPTAVPAIAEPVETAAHELSPSEAQVSEPEPALPPPPAQEGKSIQAQAQVIKIPQPVVTGSAATGQFIQLPGMPGRDGTVPKIEIKDRDEELRRLGRSGLVSRGPGGRDWRQPGAPGQRPGGPPRKRVAAAGKKTKQTLITTPAEHKRVIRMGENIAVSDLAQKMGVKGNEIIKKLWALGMMGVNINQSVDQDTATLIANEFGYQIESTAFREDEFISEGETDNPEDLVPRAPVITVMGHVDHGKTSLLDAIRKANVAAGEAGGITQHIGAYKVHTATGDVVFLDTPGHEAFTAMRARGAQMTDIVVIVVAAEEGPMPQTIEAIKHAQAAEVPILVAINKIDKPGANPAAIRTKLMEHGLVAEELGGETIYVEVSAKTKVGVDKLLEMLALQAEVLELKANPNKPARGNVVEARLDRSRGAIATVLVKEGTLRLGDLVVAGEAYGKLRAMLGDKGQIITEAGPSTPVELLGLEGVPDAGELFNVVTDEKSAKALVEHRRELRKRKEASANTRVSLENILDRIKEGAVKEVRIVLKADVQGSLEAVTESLKRLEREDVKLSFVRRGVGGITENDVALAKASTATIIGFNVRPDRRAREMAESDNVEIRAYEIIYKLLEDIEAAMLGMLAPKYEEIVTGDAEVRQVFRIPRIGGIAGCYVQNGTIRRGSKVRFLRDGVIIWKGTINSLRRFKDDVREVQAGFECGIGLSDYQDLKEGDVIETFEEREIPRV